MNTDQSPSPTAAPPWLVPRAAYVHVPFCAHRCAYCDFAIAVGKDDLIERYLDALAAELAGLGRPQPVQTLFLGGGTPTYLSAAQLGRLLGNVLRWLPLRPGHEFSIEANPGTLDAEKVAVLARHGVTRVSLGAQSFDPRLLGVLERDHAPDEVPRAVACVKERIGQVSLDLIFGVPGQSVAAWQADLERALALGPDHVSTYGLTYEKGTPLWKQRQRGAVRALDEEAERALYGLAIDTLEAAGFEHYEISNFARPGRRCRHNEVYWANHAYFGFGMGAARYVGGRRELNTRDLHGYIRKALAGESVTLQSEELPPWERARETMAVQLRRVEGVERRAFREQTGFDLDDMAGPAISRHVELGLLHHDSNRVRLTREGKYVADGVIENLL
ncbi:MAG TPA: radical SAM family heme chaperone HemW [Gemmataceae bacterium]|nr:radical SAM family heme chaperone HemW [Gemmataceae bacterium]